MKRIQEKVKDLIEVRPYQSLRDFISDPERTLAGYHFTDETSAMMAKWLDAVAGVQAQEGVAKALAGYRGVGKSHFLAALGAIVSNPELRSRMTDPLVAAGAQRLKRRRYPVAHVRRGIHATLEEEIINAVAKTLGLSAADLKTTVKDLLQIAAEKNEVPFVLIVDTAFERESRVVRDDGVLLGELAEFAKGLNVFIAVALDDDIADADGVNAAIARNYTIDYLDQTHLYNIVDQHLFPKHRHTPALLHEIYNYFRGALPNFRWSEQRFAALYPLHPAIMEIAPFVRLYAPEFAMLGFAAEAGANLLGRPASSLIALDEVFDRTELSLRKVEDLKETFDTFDRINAEVIAQIPVMQRLQAKLVLKALFLLSLEGQGATAGEICTSVMFCDENDPAKAAADVEAILGMFVSAFPSDIVRASEDGRANCYCLKVRGKENLNNALAEAIERISPAACASMMRRMARERFADWILPAESEAAADSAADFQVFWRGGLRRGRIFWNWNENASDAALPPPPGVADLLDWEVIVVNPERETPTGAEADNVPKIFWQPAPLRQDERETILRFVALLTDEDVRSQFAEQIRAAGHAHSLAVEKIWSRIFLEDGALSVEGLEVKFSDRIKGAQSLSQIFSLVLEPFLESRFPEHPAFEQTIRMADVSSLVNDLFSGARSNLAEVQELAKKFALPLGLVASRGDLYILETEENLINLPLAKEVLNLIENSGNETVSLRDVYRQLKKEPFGLVREAQHLVLTALVAQRQIEFVTSKGDRINRRSLDLKIIWDDIVGIAKPTGRIYSNERLAFWGRSLTGSDDFRSIDTPADREMARAALKDWLDGWHSARILERFAELPDEIFNTKLWRLATNAEKSFGIAAETVESVLNEFISLDEGLHRIADAFYDSEEEFIRGSKDLVVLEDFISGTSLRRQIWSYLALCEPAQDEAIEDLREKLLYLVNETYYNPSRDLNRDMEALWHEFREKFTEYFALKHDLIMKSHHLQEKFDKILRTDEWWEFENLSSLPVFQTDAWQTARENCRRFRELDCRHNVREMLKNHPFCACSFNLSQIGEWEKLPDVLWENINLGRQGFHRTLAAISDALLPFIEQVAGGGDDFSEAAQKLDRVLTDLQEIPPLTNSELVVLQKAIESIPRFVRPQRAENY